MIIQIHGAPASEGWDREMLVTLSTRLQRAEPTVVLLHRPDEIADRLPELRRVLESAQHPFGLCFLGGLHVDDDFYFAPFALRRVIPHGFFSSRIPSSGPPYIVGSHTSWGEMREVDHALRVLVPVLRKSSPSSIVGYLGGIPAESLTIPAITAKVRDLGSDCAVLPWPGALPTHFASDQPTLFLGGPSEELAPLPHFNTQLYHYRGAIRTGESSGSLHAAVSIPVIFEMNGAESTEDLAVIKVPYTDRKHAANADFNGAATTIRGLIDNHDLAPHLQQNYEVSLRLDPKEIGSRYLHLIDELS
jgi:hypothetical protein